MQNKRSQWQALICEHVIGNSVKAGENFNVWIYVFLNLMGEGLKNRQKEIKGNEKCG